MIRGQKIKVVSDGCRQLLSLNTYNKISHSGVSEGTSDLSESSETEAINGYLVLFDSAPQVKVLLITTLSRNAEQHIFEAHNYDKIHNKILF